MRGITLSVLVIAGSTALLPGSDPVGPTAPWRFDEIIHTNGHVFRGLILSENSAGVEFQIVHRNPGRPTVTFTTVFSRREIANVRPLPAPDRAALREKLAELDPTGATEQKRMDALELTAADWPGRPGGAMRYASEQFVLISAAPDEVTRRAAVRLEQLYTAFARLLPSRRLAGKPTTVILAGSMEDYRARIGTTTGPLLNPAIYDPTTNRIVCGSDLVPLGDQLAATFARHREQRAAVDRYEAEVRQLYRGSRPELERFLSIAVKERQRIVEADRINDRAFDSATRRLFGLLYHEAFHSYVYAFAYPPLPVDRVLAGEGSGELPRWLNEGLAQVFESAVVEAGELRASAADPDRLGRCRDRLKGAGLLPVAELLRAGKGSFLAAHADDRPAAARAYLTSWAVACHLTFERKLIGTKDFDSYLSAVNTGTDPVAAFEQLVGQELPDFELALKSYMLRLRDDGTAPK